MERTCDVCGAVYEAQRATSKVCSKRCRVRKSRGRAAAGVPAAPSAQPAQVVAAGGEASLEVLTLAELTAVGRERTARGLVALLLARRLDAATREPGMGMAALSRQYEVALELAVRGAAAATDPVDELKARRDHKRAG